ncbi:MULTISPECIES: type IV pilus modification protein PilV [unclassified Cupriavidus]|jgi:type IV pilus assembly protein PilV|uniref:type IV pilus modification protein PilV n=1 Tax=unclassified Cupriavidus TaxID=2640874 RepID=UPI001C004BDE|nr:MULTISPECIES: type IV pilus modification protein PilV [unclassified Cupriavidus]MCA3185202.1 type IV pilus modification protein PilV [Cupriavidus sp.]MCA3192789.1 type IV pilus modification protein PilV [Cupriavidus sp.]MCA3194990.1 type IV pilus modification protein PilV [Cupriavidus sp.]MCA3203960.1 type IV pilus modification protein PilV [Cupriavidus sp.]MCA3205719.1 type IV pilus modification protein PilV [Cupriavidus sp.]
MTPYPSPAPKADRCRPRARHARRGFSLIEALVTLVVLSIGMLALANLQLQTLVDSRTSAMRNYAALMAYNLADQIRSNGVAVTNGTFNVPKNTPVANCFAQKGCTPDEMATTAYATWLADVKESMPGGDGIVCQDSSPNDGSGSADGQNGCDKNPNAPYVIKIFWREDNGATTQLFSTALIP